MSRIIGAFFAKLEAKIEENKLERQDTVLLCVCVC